MMIGLESHALGNDLGVESGFEESLSGIYLSYSPVVSLSV